MHSKIFTTRTEYEGVRQTTKKFYKRVCFCSFSSTLALCSFVLFLQKLIITTDVILQARNQFISFKLSSHYIVLQMKVYDFNGSSFLNDENFYFTSGTFPL